MDADPATAFDVFTARLGRWWPLAELSVYGGDAAVSFTGGQIIESAADGRTAVWGTVTRWEPPDVVAFTWHPGKAAEQASRVEVTFAAAAGQTLVTLAHAGWEVFADPAVAREEYGHGWPMVLDRYRDAVGARGEAGADEAGAEEAGAGETGAGETGAEEAGDDTWVALLHRPGPAAPVSGTVFEDPRFGEHVAFLSRMHEAGYLVAAGPLADTAGDGMTILRLPAADGLSAATRLATEDDISVATGFLAVTVRPWQVLMHAQP